jgi:hypothetical protein
LDFLKRSATKAASGRAGAGGREGVLAELQGAYAGVFGAMAVGLLIIIWLAGAVVVSGERKHLAQMVASHPNVGWDLRGIDEQALRTLKQKAKAQLDFLKRVTNGRMSVAAKLDTLARALPDGVWLTAITFEERFDVAGNSQPRLTVKGACYLGRSTEELSAIQALEIKVKSDKTFLNGFSTAQLDQIGEQSSTPQGSSYRIFQLQCSTQRKL